ncbi:MAG TPA: LLM class flavin-dependent oxidoreductase [Gaiellaceae bacterium]|jgi:alkanesulfonate monooxygenase SsuD/methylene tetrahydromethanopterin reductase-like flavin-dependent oxidoreductase (luciferase family)|nr:LLM class flavin-dependent oxidoreductase [Gaiellaceae bacterium]
MRYGLQLATVGALADPRHAVRIAAAAEEAGWEALLVWDHLAWASWGEASADPWVTLGACAATTERILLGTAVTPLPRRRPWMVAQQLATLSLASGGRVVFGAGSGLREERERFGEPGGDTLRGELLDEGLDVVDRLLSGERVDHHGGHYVVDGASLAPLPVAPIPFWIGGDSPAALRRAERWQGWIPGGCDQERNTVSPAALAERVAGRAFGDVCFIGYAEQADLAAYAAAGATWWIECVWGDPEQALARVTAGPPR